MPGSPPGGWDSAYSASASPSASSGRSRTWVPVSSIRAGRAAERFGFGFEGVFRNHMVVKGRNRDTAWYAITDDEWPAVRVGFREWLGPGNLDEAGRQRRTLGELIAGARS